MRKTLVLLAALALTASAMGAQAAAPCRDGKGKFVKCAAPAAKIVGPCKDAKGKFMKCGVAKG